MNVLLAGEIGEFWRLELAAAMPEASWFDAGTPEVQAAVVANPAPGALAGLPGLRLIQSLWAGVERLLLDPTLPAGVPIARMVDPVMNHAMAETALWAVLSLQRGFYSYARQQREGVWRALPQRRAEEVSVLVLGRGQMGRAAADCLRQQGFQVLNWSRGAALAPLLAGSEIVINLLPLTPQTSGLLNAAFFAALPRGAAIVNLARGAHLVDADLLAALASGQLSHAVLDVFHTEPLAAGHTFWQHPQITLLPHAAALTDARSAATIAVRNLRALRDGQPLMHLVDRTQGY